VAEAKHARAGEGRSGSGRPPPWGPLAIAVPALLVLASPLSSVDLAYLLRAGQTMLDTGSVARTDLLSFTARCSPWVNQQWGTEVVFAAIFRLQGWLGLGVLRAGLAALTLWLVQLACRRRGAPERAAAWLTLLSAGLLMSTFGLRAQLVGVVCFATTNYLITRPERRLLWWAVPVELVWANTHGSFPLGLVLLGFSALRDLQARRSPRTSIAVLLACAGATLITPFGPGVWSYVRHLVTDPLIREVVVEWRRPGLDTYAGVVFLLSAAGSLVVFVRRRSDLPWPDWAQLAFFLLLGATAVRNGAWWGLVLPVTLAPLARVRPEQTGRAAADGMGSMRKWTAWALAAIAFVALLPWLPHRNADPPGRLLEYAPAPLTRRLEQVLRPGEGFINPQAWGSWFELALPTHPVFIDSRFEVIPDETVRASGRLTRAEPGWERTLAAIPARVLVISRQTQPVLAAEIHGVAEWTRVYEDEDGIILVRAGGSAPPLEDCD